MKSGKKILVTGANGYIGRRLCARLAASGHEVMALVRRPQADRIAGVSWVYSGLDDAGELGRLMDGCSEVYHLAALAAPWAPEPGAFHRVNVQGVANVLEASFNAGVGRVVFTSTAGVMCPSIDGGTVDEETNPEPVLTTDYERSKLAAERLVRQFVQEKGLHVVIVNPSRVFGPANPGENNPMFKMIRGYADGSWRWIPGDGTSIGNYVFVDDIVEGHLLAMEKGRPAERYILGGANADFNQLFEALSRITRRRLRMVHIPIPVMLALAHTQQFMADTFGKTPLITPGFVQKYLKNWPLNDLKAERELGYRPIGLSEGLERTLGISINLPIER